MIHRHVLTAFLSMLLAGLLPACGAADSDDSETVDDKDGGGQAGGGGAAPVISELQYSPEQVQAGQAATVSGTFSVADPDGDVKSWSLELKAPNGASQALPNNALADAEGSTAALIQFILQLNALIAGEYTFEIWVTDAAGHDSNKLQGTITAQAAN